MSQRDQFAREAMSGMIAAVWQNIILGSDKFDNGPERLAASITEMAKMSYIVADAMLLERERTNKSKAQKELEK